jgi:putative oxidoreductase
VLKFHWTKGLWATDGGFEYPLVLMLLGLVLGLVGPGSYSLDALFGIALPTALFWLGVVASIIIDVVGIMTSRQTEHAQSAA